MVKQNRAKLSKSKWVFPLNVIASGMGADGYWSASSLAITVGMAIREARWLLGKQALSPLAAERAQRLRAVRGLGKHFLSISPPPRCRQDNWKEAVIHGWPKHDCFYARPGLYGKRCMIRGSEQTLQKGECMKKVCWYDKLSSQDEPLPHSQMGQSDS